MPNVLVKIKYDGTCYHGWQVQANAVTVQEKVQDAIECIFGSRIDVKGCSRTDSGVHANMYCFSFNAPYYKDEHHMLSAFNHYLPEDICAYECSVESDEFHARYDCKGKEYIYRVYDGKYRNPFTDKYCYHSKVHIDEELMNNCAKEFIGEHDFSAFCAAKADVDDCVRTIYSFNVIRNGDIVEFKISGNGFLYNMVRIIVGTLLRVNSGKIPADSIKSIILSEDRSLAGHTAPAKGLMLNEVYY